MTPTRIWDPLYGRTQIGEFEAQLLSLPEVQRLRYIRMCNINSLLITGASEISRFEHSLGVLRLAQEWSIINKLDGRTRENLLAAAILHDVQTGPFGHSFQYVLEDTKAGAEDFLHDDLIHGVRHNYYMKLFSSAHFSGKPFAAPQLLGDRWRCVAEMIEGRGPLGPVIAGSMDLDNLDNVIRLAYHVGIAHRSNVDEVLRIVRGFRPGSRPGRLSVNRNVVPDIASWQDVRRKLYEFLLLDWAEFSAKGMLTSAVEGALSAGLLGTDSWSQTDDGFLNSLEKHAIGEYQHVASLIRRVRTGELYSPIFLERSSDTEMYQILSSPDAKKRIIEHLEKVVLRKLNVSRNVIFHVILDVGKTERAVALEIDGHQNYVLGKNSKSLLVGIFLSKSLPEGSWVARQVRAATRDYVRELGLRETEPLADPLSVGQSVDGRQLSFL